MADGAVSGRASSDRVDQIVVRAQRIADEVLWPVALDTDAAEAVPVALLDVLAEAGLYGLYASAQVGGLDLDRAVGERVVEALSGACLTTTFVWMQHLSTAGVVSHLQGELRDEWAAPLASGAKRAGIAFSHLRHPDPPSLTATETEGGYSVDGFAPLVTGWGLIDVVHVAARLGDDIAWLLMDARAAPTLQVKRLELAAVNASATVSLRFAGHFVPRSRLTEVQALQDWLAKDAAGLRTNGFLSLGVARRCLSLLDQPDPEKYLAPARDALVAALPAGLPEARARASLLALDCAAAVIAAGGGRSMVRQAQAQRLGREALFLLVQGQTESIRYQQLHALQRRWVQ